MTRKLFVTTALPYANGPLHIGHIMEYIQADIWVRFQRMRGHEVHFVCADDAHGAPIMIAAEKAGKTPEQFVAEMLAGRKPYLDGFHICASITGIRRTRLRTPNYRRTIYRRLSSRRSSSTPRPIEQFYDPVKGMFLPDRYIKGDCPVCHSKDQNGDSCEVCSSVYLADRTDRSVLGADRCAPELRTSEHFFFRLSDPRCVEFLRGWVDREHLQPEGREQGARMARWRRGCRQGARRLGHLARRAVFRHPDS